MTGYGRFEQMAKEYKVVVEIKSVNHRYCDMSIKLPKRFNALEGRLRHIIKEYANRGKIDVYINYDNYTDCDVSVKYHEKIAGDYVSAVRKASERFGLQEGITSVDLLRFPEVITLEEESVLAENFFPVLADAVRAAGERFLQAREAEGKLLYEDITAKLLHISDLVSFAEKRSPQIMQEYQEKVRSRIKELLGDSKVDEGVLATELVIYADKVCVDEETVRLRSHIQSMGETLEKDAPIGRKLDFIAQEMNREANTILSKANDKELSRNAIDLKTEIEKIREQVQNIE